MCSNMSSDSSTEREFEIFSQILKMMCKTGKRRTALRTSQNIVLQVSSERGSERKLDSPKIEKRREREGRERKRKGKTIRSQKDIKSKTNLNIQ